MAYDDRRGRMGKPEQAADAGGRGGLADAYLIDGQAAADHVHQPEGNARGPRFIGQAPDAVTHDGLDIPDVDTGTLTWAAQSLVDELGEGLPRGRPCDVVSLHDAVLGWQPAQFTRDLPVLRLLI
jgi:hypothetical protein